MPVMTAAIRTTTATPMPTPRIVSSERKRLPRSESTPTRTPSLRLPIRWTVARRRDARLCSLIAERHHGVHARGPDRGVDARRHPGPHAEHDAEDDPVRGHRDGQWRGGAHDPGEEEPDGDADDGADP